MSADPTDSLTLLGNTVRGAVDAGGLETFPAPAGIGVVRFRTAELTAFCPVTAQPDLYAMDFGYLPDDRCLESKSFKLYLHSFRDRGIFCETLAVTLLQDLVAVLRPRAATVRLEQQVRGGLVLHAQADHEGGVR
ncbi:MULTISPECIES: preQ(1) synthase [Amycolatopsis]|uniref:preQ(1) synthase n=1 Tax=Amycolatopsis TaxID=1813 RepID=UPI00058733D6|nr:preQ(1) synthase [Amycolatopsis decaplanina]